MEEMKLVMGVVGPQGSGKGTVVKYLVEKYGAEQLRFGQPLQDILDRLYIPTSRPNYAKLFEGLNSSFGAEILVQAVMKDAEKHSANFIAIEGFRRWPEVESFREIPNFTLVFINAEPEIRYKRMIQRNEKAGEKDLTYEQFLDQEKLSTEVDIMDIGKTADFVLNNNGTFDELDWQIDEIIKTVKKG